MIADDDEFDDDEFSDTDDWDSDFSGDDDDSDDIDIDELQSNNNTNTNPMYQRSFWVKKPESEDTRKLKEERRKRAAKLAKRLEKNNQKKII